ncbi:unnamed protein product [Coccothraustes coccothraustes]
MSLPRTRAHRRFPPPGRCGAPSAPRVPHGRCLRSPPWGPHCGHELPGVSYSFLCVLWVLSPLACAPQTRFAAFVRGVGPAAPPRGPHRPVLRPPRTWAARTAGLGRESAFL